MNKELLLICLCFCLSTIGLAQEMTVMSFNSLTQDLSARTHPRTDLNGEPCALIKVQIPELNNITFEGWVIDQTYTPGEYLVYVPANTKKIIVKHPNFLPLEYVFPEKIEGKVTYKMVIQLPQISDEDRIIGKLARITVYDKDSKELVGAEVKSKITGYVYGTTRSDGTIAVGFDKKGETAIVIVSHPSYSDTKEIRVEAGVHDYKVYFRDYSPPEDPTEKLARITVYDKDSKELVGAEVKNKTTGYVYGTTHSGGIIEVGFDKKGETANVIVSHPSYSDITEILVRAGDHDYKVYLRSYSPPEKSRPSHVWKCKPEKWTMELSAIGGCNFGVALDFTASYFLIGFGVDWMILAPKQTVTTSLVNYGYTGNFTKTSTMSLSGSRTNLFLDIGIYFKYFSLSCQVGLLCGTTINRTSLYDGWGYGLVDGEINEYFGGYRHRAFNTTTSDKELHLTLTPQVKGYIPVGYYKSTSILIGLGYTFIPLLNYYPGFSGSLGVHFRF